jgi:hypothetical protein
VPLTVRKPRFSARRAKATMDGIVITYRSIAAYTAYIFINF